MKKEGHPKNYRLVVFKDTSCDHTFLTRSTVETKDITFSIPEINDLDIIASGVIPPNPAELLLTSRVKELFDTVKQ